MCCLLILTRESQYQGDGAMGNGLAEWFHTRNTDVFDKTTFAPNYNIAPDSFQPVVRLSHETGEREFALMRWKLVPNWSKTLKSKYDTINARSDKLKRAALGKSPFKVVAV